MAEDQGKQDEEKFDYSDTIERVAYISLEEAKVLAMEHARDNAELYGPRYRGVTFAHEVISGEEGEDYYDLKLRFRPAGRFRGEPGIEQFIIDKVGTIRVRQVLDEPVEADRPARRRPPVLLLIAIGVLGVAVVAVVIGVILTRGNGEGQAQVPPTATPPPASPTLEPTRVPDPTASPVVASTTVATATSPPPPKSVPAPVATLAPTSTPVPTTEGTIHRTLVYRQITDFPSDNRIAIERMKLSADGSKIIFTNRAKQIYTLDADGSNLTKVFDYAPFRTGCPCVVPFIDISADGSRVIWTDTVGEIFVADSTGADQTRVATALTAPDGSAHGPLIGVNPRITADGRQVYFANSGTPGFSRFSVDVAGVWKVNADGTGLTQLFSHRQMADQLFEAGSAGFNANLAFCGGFDISADGSRMAFGTFESASAGHTVSYDGTFRKLADFERHACFGPIISGDGGKILVVRLMHGLGWPVLSTNFDGTDLKEILPNIGGQSQVLGGVSSDGSKVIAQGAGVPITLLNSDETGRSDLVAAPCFGGGKVAGMRNSFNRAGIGPVISVASDGQRFSFTTDPLNDGTRQIWIADLNPSSASEVPFIPNVGFTPDFVLVDRSSTSTITARVVSPSGDSVEVYFEAFLTGVHQFRAIRTGYMVDDGSGDDLKANDGIYTATSIRHDLGEPGPLTIRIHAADTRSVTAVDVGPFFMSKELPGTEPRSTRVPAATPAPVSKD